MKSLFAFAAAIVLVATPVFADKRETRPDRLFWASSEVGESVSELQASGFKKIGKAKVMIIEGGCGFAGCDTTYLVGVTLSSDGGNTQVTSVNALVTVPAVGNTSVKLAEIK